MLKVISGKHRGRRIEVLDDKAVRPTSGRTRAAIFNILHHASFLEFDVITDAVVVDLFCGSGALGLEALSRGAAHVTFIDQNPKCLALIEQAAEKWGERSQVTTLRSDSTNIPPARKKCMLAFLDAPYRQGLTGKGLETLKKSGWLENGAVVVAETAKEEDYDLPEGFTLLDERVYNNTKVRFIGFAG